MRASGGEEMGFSQVFFCSKNFFNFLNFGIFENVADQ